jgi:hypothetical protein
MVNLDRTIKLMNTALGVAERKINEEIKVAASKGYYQVKVSKEWNEAINDKVLDMIEEHGFTTNDKQEYILIRWM